jgi:hypothetical protein
MKQVPEAELLVQERQISAELDHWLLTLQHLKAAQALFDGLLAVCRARDRGEPYWMLDVRRAQARLAALRASRARTSDQAGEP